MNKGRIEQVGTPLDIWGSPSNAFVGTFIGEANLVECTVRETNGSNALLCLDGTGTECFRSNQIKGLKSEAKAQAILRPQMLEIYREKSIDDTSVSGRVIESMFMGTLEYVKVELTNKAVIIVHRKLLSGDPLEPDESVVIGIDPNQAFVYGGEFQT
jgi:ABC-type Fe3+/spermidine/putrescine transport system ATPase subunit